MQRCLFGTVRTVDVGQVIIGSTACAFGLFVVVVAVARWGLVADSPKGRALRRYVGDHYARWCYAGLGAALIALGLWVFFGE